MAFTGDTARALVTDAAVREAASTVWSDTRIDQAIMFVTNWCNSRYKIVTSTGTATTTNTATTAGSWATAVVTLTVASGHGIVADDWINVDGVLPTGYNGTFRVSSVTATTILYALTDDPGTYTTAGTVALIGLDLSGISATLNLYRRRLRRARIGLVSRKFDIINYDDMLNQHEADRSQGEPTKIAFETNTTEKALVHPAPDATYTVDVQYLNIPTEWTAGTASTPASFNIDDDILYPILYWGVPAAMQGNMQNRRVTSDPKWATMIEHLDTILGETADMGISQLIPD